MSLNDNQQHQLCKLLEYRKIMLSSLDNISDILQTHFPNEYSLAYQHWIPQISTALQNDDKWLPRGQYNMQDTLNKINDNDDCGSGVMKYIK